VTGEFERGATFGDIMLTSSKTLNSFIAKADQNGNWLWAQKAGEIGYVYSITADDAGNCYVTGTFYDTVSFGDITLTGSKEVNTFIAKMDTDGNWLWAESAGGTDSVCGRSIAVDGEGNSYVTGNFKGTTTFGSATLTSIGKSDIFVAKADKNGKWLWAKSAGGPSSDGGLSIAIGNEGNSYVTGYFGRDPDFSTAIFGDITLTSNGWEDIFVAKLEKDDSVGVEDYVLSPPGTELYRNYPNPFNPNTKLSFSLAEPGMVKIDIYNLKGQKVRTLTNSYYSEGMHSISWDGSDSSNKQVSSGIYFYRMETGNYTKTLRMSLIK
jgi:hypothetical protein